MSDVLDFHDVLDYNSRVRSFIKVTGMGFIKITGLVEERNKIALIQKY